MGMQPMDPADKRQPNVKVAASIRDRNGYCFGLEFLGLLPTDREENTEPDFAEMAAEPGGSASGDGSLGSPQYIAKVPSTTLSSPRMGVDQIARRPLRTAIARQPSQSTSVSVSSVYTGSRRNAAVPHEPMLGAMRRYGTMPVL